MTEIEKVKGEIEVLEAKLALLEEMEDHMEQEIQKAFDKVCGGFPPNLSGDRFDFFRWGYEAHQSLVDDAKKIIDEASFTNCIIEGNPPDGCGSWSEWFKLFGSKGILHNLRISSKNNKTPEPYCPDKVKDDAWKSVALRFGENLSSIGPYGYSEMTADEWLKWANDTYEKNAAKVLKWKTRNLKNNKSEKLSRFTQALLDGKIDERGYVDMREPKPMDDVVNKLVEEYQSQKLFNRLVDELGYDFDACNDVVDLVEDWILDEQSSEGSQNVNTELLVEGFNDAIRKMKEMLR
jgi:hypothetical protein